jgi:hypothetical protein
LLSDDQLRGGRSHGNEGSGRGGGVNSSRNCCTNDLSYFREGKDCGARGIGLRIDKENKEGYTRKREILPQTPSVAAGASSSLSSLTLEQEGGGGYMSEKREGETIPGYSVEKPAVRR